jgi:Family of unknown function (DUF6519)
MRGDFTRNTFDASKHYSRVLMQQGRVQLDADFNEQDAILLWRLRLLAKDIVGRHAAAADLPDSFKVAAIKVSPSRYAPRDFSVAAGRYYVEGMLCENDAAAQYTGQPSFPLDINDDTAALSDSRTYLVYLDVWERHLTYVEDPSIREVALGGSDTCSRGRVVWQVRVSELRDEQASDPAVSGEDLLDQFLLLAGLDSSDDPMLRVRAAPDTHYSGSANHLYRIEVHRSGSAADARKGHEGAATFKWSRDNGSVIIPIEEISGSELKLANLARNGHPRLQLGDWVEVVDDAYELRGRAFPLLQVTQIQNGDRHVTLSDSVPSEVGRKPALHPYVRRWDQRAGVREDGTLPVAAMEPEGWIHVEDGVQIKFSASGSYRTGDFWMFPARTITADVEWPEEAGYPRWVTPHGMTHYYAPLAKLEIDAAGKPEVLQSYRRRAIQLWTAAK